MTKGTKTNGSTIIILRWVLSAVTDITNPEIN